MKTADQRRTLPRSQMQALVSNATGRYPQQGIEAKSEVLRKRNYIKGGIPYIDVRFGSMH